MEKQLFDLTAPQKSIWLTEQYFTNTNMNNICGTAIVSELLDFNNLNAAINLVIKKNDIFRLHFVEESGVLKQYFGEYESQEIELVELDSEDEISALEQNLLSKVFNINEKLYEFKMFRVKNSNKSGYMLNIHHIISDALTLGLTCKKIIQEYSALINNDIIEVNEKATYQNYIKSEKEYFTSQKYENDKTYWDEKFKDLPNVVTIPSTKCDSNDFSCKANRYNYIIEKDKMNKIIDFCTKSKISVFNLFMGILAIYMYRVNDINDFVIGTPILNRTNFNEKNTLGMFINVAPLRINIADNSNVSELLSKIATDSMGLLRHQKYSYQSILENIRKNNSSIPNLYNIVLSYQITKANVESNISYETRWAFNGNCSDDIDIHLFDLDNTGELNISYDYKIDKYNEDDIIDLNNRLNYIIDQVLENSNLKIDDLEIATPEERNKILNEFNNTKVDYPSDKTIVELFEEQVELHPDNIAVVFEDEKLTYRELNEKANQLARFLIKNNISPGTIIGLRLNKSLEMIIGIIAIIKCGCCYLPINMQYPEDRVNYMLEDSNSKVLLYANNFLTTINSDIKSINISLNNKEIYKLKKTNLNLKISPEDLIYIIYTSGSTGKPKGAMLCHRNVVRLFKNDNFLFDFNSNDVWTMFHSVAFDFSVWEMYGALLFGGKLVLVTDEIAQDPKLFINLMKTEHVTILNQTPTYFYKLLKTELENEEKNLSLHYIIFGGEALKLNLIRGWYLKYPKTKLINMYGITETTVHVTFKQLNEADLSSSSSNIGTPIPTLHVIIVDKNLHLLPFGTIGEMCVLGDGVFKGYLNRPDLNSTKLLKIPEYSNQLIYRSGDTAIMHKDGHLEYIGRIDNQVKIRGFRIELGEIEEKILKYSNIETCIVTKKTDEFDRDLLCAYYIKNAPINISSLRTLLNKHLPKYMIPQYFIEIDKVPININGKIDLKALPLPKNNQTKTKKEILKPRNEVDKKLVSVYKSLLHTEIISITDSFFELGGDSLTAITICGIINSTFNTNITVKDILEKNIIMDLADYILQLTNSSTVPYTSNIITVKEDYSYPLSSAQKRIFYASNMNPNLSVYNISGGIEFFEKLDLQKTKIIFNTLITRHESFRTYFEITDENIYQKILPKLNLEIECKTISHKDVNNEFKIFNTTFDLSKAPLLKIQILYLDNNHTMLLINMHHIISDGTSMQILLNDFCTLYNNENLPTNKFTYKDFINYEQYFSGSEKYENNKKFWLNEFADEIPTLNLPTNYARPSVFSYKGTKVHNKLTEELTMKILKTSKELQVTPYMFLLSAYYILLYKYTGQDNIVVGTPVANRDTLEFSNIIGMFVNTLAIRKKIHSSKTPFLNFLNDVRDKCLNCFAHQNYPFDELVKELNIQRDVSRNPLFDTMFIYQSNGMKNLKLNGVETKYYIPDTNISKFDLSLEIIPNDKELLLNIEYCTDLFTEEFIKNFSNHYIQLVQNIINNLDSKISEFEILTIPEKNLIFNKFNNTNLNVPKEQNLIDMFNLIVNKYPNNIAVELNNKKITYQELDYKSNSLAQLLINNNIKPGDIVGVHLNKSLELIISIWAILKIGATYMPMYSKYLANRLEYMLQNSKSNIIITNSNLESNINLEIKKIIINNYSDIKNSNTKIVNTISSNSIAYIIYTSGSTGKPKGVKIKHSNLINFIYAFNKFYNNTISSKDTFLSSTNISFDVSIWEIFLPLLNGSKLVLYNEEIINDIINYTNYIVDNKITGLYIPPNILNEVYSLLKNKSIYIEKLLVGVESIKKNTLNNYLSLNSNMIIVNGYGPTETTICATAFNYKLDNKDNNFVSIGKPIYNNHIYILNEDMQLQPIGVSGEMYITGSGVGDGYITSIKENNFQPNKFDSSSKYMYKTGDFAKWNKDGTITFLGRKDSQIKISGYRIELEEIENKILEFSNISKTIVLCQTDYKNRKYLVAYITINDKISISKLKEYLRKYLPRYMIPAYFEILDEFPYTPNGKINKKMLPLPNINKNQQYFVPARNSLDTKLLQIFEKLLDISPIGITDNFFELGGDSLLAINLQIELMKITEGVSYADIFLNPTVKELANKLNNMNNIVESLSDTVDLLNCNTFIQNNNIISSTEKIDIGNILLTGSTGYLGIHVLSEFLENESGKVYCLLRPEKGISLENKLLNKLHFYFNNKFDNLLNKRIIIVNGDITLDNLGLSNVDYEIIKKDISAIVNCAAKVSHFGKYELYKKINVDGVQNLIKFCKENSKTLYHMSTISISGNKLSSYLDESINVSTDVFKENNFFINQVIDNVYVKSKFEAEKLIISEMQNGLDAYILRIGNLMGRYSDGKFQQNIEENAYINRLISFIRIRNIPKYFVKHTLEFTPVDYCAKAVVKLLTTNHSNNKIFHLFNNNRISIKKLLNIFEKDYYKINIVSNSEFKNIINSLLKSNNSSTYLNGLISDFDKNGKLDYEQKIRISSEFSNSYLNMINFEWTNIDDIYITQFFKYLNALYKF